MSDVLPLLYRLGACAGLPVEDFYPEGRGTAISAAAREACGACPVLEECREWAIAHEAFGYWAGTTERWRMAERRRRQRRGQRTGVAV